MELEEDSQVVRVVDGRGQVLAAVGRVDDDPVAAADQRMRGAEGGDGLGRDG